MTNKEALAILGLEHPANRQMIESRYARLIKGYGRSNPEKMAEINEAYRTLTEDSRKVTIEPRLQKEVAGKSLYQWKNIVHYGKTPALVTLVVIALVVSIVMSVVRKEDPDFTLAAIGSFYNREDNIMEDKDSLYTITDFAEDNLGVERPLVDLLSIGSNADPQVEMANVTKRILYAGGMTPADILLIDKANFDYLQGEGVLISLEDFYAELATRYSEEELAIIKPVYGHVSISDEELDAKRAEEKANGKSSSSETEEDKDWLSEDLYIVGFDFSESQLFNSLSMLGYEQIVGITIHNKDNENAYDFIENLIAKQDELMAISPGTVEPTPTPASSNIEP